MIKKSMRLFKDNILDQGDWKDMNQQHSNVVYEVCLLESLTLGLF